MKINLPTNYQAYLNKGKKITHEPAFKASLVFLFSVLVVSLFAIFAIRPALIEILRLTKEIKERKIVKETLATKINNLTLAQKNYNQLGTNLNNLNEAIPTTVQFNEAAGRINYLCWQNKLKLINIIFNGFPLLDPLLAKENLENDQTLEFKLVATGNFLDIKKFLTDLENLDRLSQIDTVSLTSISDLTAGSLQLELTGRFFYLPKINNF